MHSITPRPPGSDLQIPHIRDEADAYVVFATSSAPARCPDREASSVYFLPDLAFLPSPALKPEARPGGKATLAPIPPKLPH
ncbi:MAG: hypothetical protein ACOYOH_09530 [Paracraurococcus sp.]|jgi:hypothetical protein